MVPDVSLINFPKPFFITTNAPMITVYYYHCHNYCHYHHGYHYHYHYHHYHYDYHCNLYKICYMFLYKILCIFLIYLSHSEYVKITDGVGTEVFHHQGCVPFATENLLDVQFGSSGNISVQVCLGNNQSSVKIKFAVLKNGISSGMF